MNNPPTAQPTDGPLIIRNWLLRALGFNRRDHGVFVFAIATLIAPNLLFAVYIVPWMWTHATLASVIIWALLLLFALSTHLITSFLEPGYLPKNLDAPRDSMPIPTTRPLSTLQSSIRQPPGQLQPLALPPNYPFNGEFIPHLRSVIVNGWEVRIKYCVTCKTWRTPRCSHCSTCGRCVEDFDHHCPYVGTCVGKRNQRFFYFFLVSVFTLAAYVLGFSLAMLVVESFPLVGEFWESVSKHPVNDTLVIFSFIMMMSLCPLTAYHTLLVMQNMTTHDQMREQGHKFRHANSTAPFDQGSVLKNCYHVLCRPIEKSRAGNWQPLALDIPISQQALESQHNQRPLYSTSIYQQSLIPPSCRQPDSIPQGNAQQPPIPLQMPPRQIPNLAIPTSSSSSSSSPQIPNLAIPISSSSSSPSEHIVMMPNTTKSNSFDLSSPHPLDMNHDVNSLPVPTSVQHEGADLSLSPASLSTISTRVPSNQAS